MKKTYVEDDFYKQRISKRARDIYDQIENQIVNQIYGNFTVRTKISMSAMKDAIEAYKAIRLDKPQYFFLGRSIITKLNGRKLMLETKQIYTQDEIRRINKVLEIALCKLMHGIRNLSAFDKEKVIYTRIACNYKYSNNNCEHCHNVVGLTVYKEGVCESFTALLILALRRAGIPAIKVVGYGKEAHCWCIAWINDIPYHLDVTWDLAGRDEVMGYFYFNLTDQDIKRDHIIATEGLPKCTNPKYNYYYMNHWVCADANQAEIMISKELWSRKNITYVKGEKVSIKLGVSKALRCVPFGSYICKYSVEQNAAVIYKSKNKELFSI